MLDPTRATMLRWSALGIILLLIVTPAVLIALAWASLPLVNRIETMRRFANNVRGHETKFAALIARETGRPLWDAKAEVHALTMSIDLAVGAISERAGSRRIEGTIAREHAHDDPVLESEPRGVLREHEALGDRVVKRERRRRRQRGFVERPRPAASPSAKPFHSWFSISCALP